MATAPQTPDTPQQAHRLELYVLPPELFPDVGAVRRFFGSELYRAILLAGQAIATGETRDATPDPLWDDALAAYVNLLFDLKALGPVVNLPSESALRGEWCERRADDEENNRRVRGLLAAMALDGLDADDTQPIAQLASSPSVCRAYTRDWEHEDGDDAA